MAFEGFRKRKVTKNELPPPERDFDDEIFDTDSYFGDPFGFSGSDSDLEIDTPSRLTPSRLRNPISYEDAAKLVKVDRGTSAEALGTPEILDNIRFGLIRDGKGGLVGYKSSEVGRKVVRLAPSAQESILFNLDTGRDYRVRIVGDTEPGNPNKGAYLAEILRPSRESDRYQLEHRGAQVARARRFAGSDGFKVLASMINADPDLSAEYRPVAARHKEYRGLHRDKEERHRNFTGMLSGIMMSERGNRLLNRVIDRTIARESEQMKEELRSAEKIPYVPGVVVGAGVYGAVLATSRQMQLPDVPDLTIEQGPRIGGQFAQYENDLFRLNSRRRPEEADKPHLPGTSQSLNSAGNHAVMHSSDTGMESYPYQSTLSDTARVNFFLAGKAVVNASVERVRQNPDGENGGRLIVEFLDNNTGEVLEVATDRITFSTGIGEEVDRLDPSDPTTRKILAEEKEKAKQGGDARVQSLSEFGTRMSDSTNPFPMKGMKRLVLSGKGDSAAVIAGIALGYESQVGKTSSQLDSVEQILWIGQDLVSKEEFLENCRVRYAQIGLEFPRDKFENYYHRITPIPEARSNRLQRTADGGIRVLLEDTDERFARRNPTTANSRSLDRRGRLRNESSQFLRSGVEGDYFIYAHGFEDKTDEVLLPTSNIIIKNDEPDSYEQAVFRDIVESIASDPFAGEVIYFKKGPFKYVEVLTTGIYGDSNERMVNLRTLTADRKYVEERITISEFRSRQAYFELANIAYAEQPSSLRSNEIDIDFDTEFSQVRGERRAISKFTEARNGGDIYKVGPAANLELSAEERDSIPALTSIGENTASIFRYIDLVEAQAERHANEDKLRGVQKPTLFASTERTSTGREVATEEESFENEISVDVDTMKIARVGLSDNSLDLLRLGIGDILSRLEFVDPQSEIILTVSGSKGDGPHTTFEVTTEFTRSYGRPSNEIIEKIIRDPLVAGVLQKVISNTRSGAAEIRIPIDETARAVPADITLKTIRG